MSAPALTYAARYVFPVDGPPIADGAITLSEGRIRWVGQRDGRVIDRDLGNAAITPGFVNAHTHLELSRLDPNPDASGAEDEIDWLKRVIQQRRDQSPEALEDVARANAQAAVAAGTTSIADISTGGLSWPAIADAPLRGVVFAEILGLKRSRGLVSSQAAWDFIASIDAMQQVRANCRLGVSPHAPYSTSGWLYQRAAETGSPLSTHLAEMPEERELLTTRGGRLREFLEDLGAWDEDFEPIGPSPADYVRKGELRNSDWLIAHGNYLEPSEFWQFLPEAAPKGQRVAIAYCPRTHARFGHAPHPYLEILRRGGVVCIGTDSLASTETLSVLDEIRFLRRTDPQADGRLLLTMATLFGAWAMRADSVTGSLKPGKSADLAVVALPDREADDPHDLLLNSDAPVVGAAFEGRFHWRPSSSS